MTKNDLFAKLHSGAPKPVLGETPAEEQTDEEEPTKSRSARAYLESLKDDRED